MTLAMLETPPPAPTASSIAAAAVTLLLRVEELPDPAVGALCVGVESRVEGTVLVEGGRVCWATARGMQRRLTDLLCAEGGSSVDKAKLDEVFRQCRADGRPLGEALVERKLVSAEGLRTALKQHTVEGIRKLAEGKPGQLRWVPHQRARYDAVFTFGTADLLTALSAELLSPAAERARALALPTSSSSPLVVFHRGQGMSIPMPVHGVGLDVLSTTSLLALGRWGASTGDLARATPDGQAAVAWREGGLLLAGLAADTLELGKLLGLAHRRS